MTTQRSPHRRLAVTGTVAALLVVVLAATPGSAKQTVHASDLAKGAVTSPKIAKKAVKSGKIAKGAVKPGKLSDGAVQTSKLAAGAVTPDKLASSARPLWAVVWSGPAITRGYGAVSVATEGVSWQFRLVFDRDVSACSTTASMTAANAGNPEQIGMVSVAPFSGDPNAVLVVTRDHDGVGAARGFTVQVMC
ncbi:hypothetical protein [Nocardioides humi]|uniref:Secreted protein n=1 Tax=Nocardioides humi TaxID=449461 RepID=A0ABN2AMF3_9ACTN|nr:hypothetical protein [Nocardioides humi]